MPEASSSLSLPTKLTLKALVNVILIWGLDTYLPAYFSVVGGLAAYIIIGSLLTLLNMFLRPLLTIITFPFRLLFTLFTVIGVHAFFLYVIYEITLKMDPSIVVLTITGGFIGWLTVSVILGISNWVMKHVL